MIRTDGQVKPIIKLPCIGCLTRADHRDVDDHFHCLIMCQARIPELNDYVITLGICLECDSYDKKS